MDWYRLSYGKIFELTGSRPSGLHKSEAEKMLQRSLKNMATTQAKVIRDGVTTFITSVELVPGDVVVPNRCLATETLTLFEFLAVGTLSSVVFFAVEIEKFIRRRKLSLQRTSP